MRTWGRTDGRQHSRSGEPFRRRDLSCSRIQGASHSVRQGTAERQCAPKSGLPDHYWPWTVAFTIDRLRRLASNGRDRHPRATHGNQETFAWISVFSFLIRITASRSTNLLASSNLVDSSHCSCPNTPIFRSAGNHRFRAVANCRENIPTRLTPSSRCPSPQPSPRNSRSVPGFVCCRNATRS